MPGRFEVMLAPKQGLDVPVSVHRWKGRKVDGRSTAIVAITALSLSAGLFIWRLRLLRAFNINRDEFEHLHAAWCISRGLVPYRDFFEHHTPLLWYMLAPLYHFYSVDKNPDAAVAFIFMARQIMMILTGVSLILTFFLARLWRGNRVAWIATGMLSACVGFTQKTLEIRPDVLAMVLWLGCLLSVFKAFEAPTKLRQPLLFVLSGLLLGSALMCTQKVLVLLPLFGLGMFWYLMAGEGEYSKRLANCVWLCAGFSGPILTTLLFYGVHGSLHQFIYYNVLVNLRWKTGLPFPGLISLAFWQNPALILLGVLGLLLEGWRQCRDLVFTRDKLLLLATLGAIGGVIKLPEAWLQYYLTFWPLLAIYAAEFLTSSMDKFLQLVGASTNSRIVETLVGAALPVLLIASSVPPVVMLRKQLAGTTNSRQLHQLRWVLVNSQPNDTVLDCWSGLGVFRPNAYFYSMLYDQMLSAGDRERLVSDLRSGQLAPKLIFPSNDLLRWVSPDAPAALLERYKPVVGEFPIFVRTQHRRLLPGIW